MPESSIENNVSIAVMPSKTFKIDGTKLTSEIIDKKEALSQSIDVMLSVEKNKYIIFPFWFGTEIKSLIGQEYAYISSESERMIRDTLLADDRVKDITDFSMSKYDKDSVTVKFTVQSIFGKIDITKEWSK